MDLPEPTTVTIKSETYQYRHLLSGSTPEVKKVNPVLISLTACRGDALRNPKN